MTQSKQIYLFISSTTAIVYEAKHRFILRRANECGQNILFYKDSPYWEIRAHLRIYFKSFSSKTNHVSFPFFKHSPNLLSFLSFDRLIFSRRDSTCSLFVLIVLFPFIFHSKLNPNTKIGISSELQQTSVLSLYNRKQARTQFKTPAFE